MRTSKLLPWLLLAGLIFIVYKFYFVGQAQVGTKIGPLNVSRDDLTNTIKIQVPKLPKPKKESNVAKFFGKVKSTVKKAAPVVSILSPRIGNVLKTI
jgi:hypothetical protein